MFKCFVKMSLAKVKIDDFYCYHFNRKKIIFTFHFVFIFFHFFIFSFHLKAAPSKADEPKLIVISMDALMFNQLNEAVTPVISNFYKNGVHCPKVQPVFPTKTLTNHFSIATGIFPILKNKN